MVTLGQTVRASLLSWSIITSSGKHNQRPGISDKFARNRRIGGPIPGAPKLVDLFINDHISNWDVHANVTMEVISTQNCRSIKVLHRESVSGQSESCIGEYRNRRNLP